MCCPPKESFLCLKRLTPLNSTKTAPSQTIASFHWNDQLLSPVHSKCSNNSGSSPPMVANTARTKSTSLSWSNDSTQAFQKAKTILADAVQLTHPVKNAHLALTTDASQVAAGAVLEQKVQGQWRPLAFFSKQLRKPEQKYSAFDRELLAIFLAVKHFRHFLEGRQFTIYTDHKPLLFMFQRANDPWSNRQARHIAKISEFSTTICHVAGKANRVADALSRCNQVNHVTLTFDFQRLAEDQKTMELGQHSLKLEEIELQGSNQKLLCDMSKPNPRRVLPPIGEGTPSTWCTNCTTQESVKQYDSWQVNLSGKASQKTWHYGLANAQHVKLQKCRDTRSRAHHVFLWSPSVSAMLHVDIIGRYPLRQVILMSSPPLTDSRDGPSPSPLSPRTRLRSPGCSSPIGSAGSDYRWNSPPTVDPNSSRPCGKQCANLLGSKELRQQPTTGNQRHRRKVPQATQDALTCRITNNNWADQIPWILLGIRNARKKDLKCSPADIVFGGKVSLPGDMWTPPTPADPSSLASMLNAKISHVLPVPTRKNPKSGYVPAALANADFVFCQRRGQETVATFIQRTLQGPRKTQSVLHLGHRRATPDSQPRTNKARVFWARCSTILHSTQEEDVLRTQKGGAM